MRILVVAATEAEIAPLMSDFDFAGKSNSDQGGNADLNPSNPGMDANRDVNRQPEILITGVGMVAAAFALAKHLSANQYDLVVNFGMAGSFDRSIAIGEVLEISEDTFSELGAEDDDDFLPIGQMGFGEATFYPTTKIANLYNLFNTFNLKTVSAITVNTVHGNEASIRRVTGRLNPQLESMEGAAVFYACSQLNVPCLQIRAVSNYVEKRNRNAWNIPLAIKNLNTFAVEFLKLYA